MVYWLSFRQAGVSVVWLVKKLVYLKAKGAHDLEEYYIVVVWQDAVNSTHFALAPLFAKLQWKPTRQYTKFQKALLGQRSGLDILTWLGHTRPWLLPLLFEGESGGNRVGLIGPPTELCSLYEGNLNLVLMQDFSLGMSGLLCRIITNYYQSLPVLVHASNFIWSSQQKIIAYAVATLSTMTLLHNTWRTNGS